MDKHLTQAEANELTEEISLLEEAKRRMQTKPRDLINEELSIAEEVYGTSTQIFLKVAEEIKHYPYSNYKKGVKMQEFTCTGEILGKEIDVKVIHYNFGNHSYFEKYKDEIDFDEGRTICDGDRFNYIRMCCYSITGQLDSAAALDTIQHEVEHVYQGLMGSSLITTYNDLYTTAANNLNNKDERIRTLAFLIYNSQTFEIDAFVNGLYGFLMQQNGFIDYDTICKCPLYERLLTYRTLLSNVLDDKEKYEDVCRLMFRKTLYQIIKSALKGEKYMMNKIGKVIVKARKDRQEQNIGHLNPIFERI